MIDRQLNRCGDNNNDHNNNKLCMYIHLQVITLQLKVMYLKIEITQGHEHISNSSPSFMYLAYLSETKQELG